MATCDHCSIPLDGCTVIHDTIDNVQRKFCCHGCQGAYRIITDAGLDAFYRKRTWNEDGVPEHVFEDGFDQEFLATFVTAGPTGTEINFYVEGVRCASCVWLIEKILMKLPGIHAVRLNYATHRLKVVFHPDALSPTEIAGQIRRIGYRPKPYRPGEIDTNAAVEKKDLLIRFGTASFFSMQLMVYSISLYAGYFQGMEPAYQRLLQILAGFVATPVVFYAGAPFLSGGLRSVRNRAPNMDTLIALGVLSAYGYSLYAIISRREVYFDSAAMIITLILLGRLFETTARHKAGNALEQLLSINPDRANKLQNGQIVSCESSTLAPGNRILVRPGERVPVDGIIAAGESEFNKSVLTGESMPMHRKTSMPVIAGAINTLAPVEITVTATTANSYIARIAGFMDEAQAKKAPVQRLADTIAAWFVPVVLLLSLLTFGYWYVHRGILDAALLHAISVLVVACPCALGLATPMAVLIASGTAAGKAILFRGGDIIETTARLTTACFDKTGTLTLGCPRIHAINSSAPEELLKVAASLETGSLHPLAAAVCDYAKAHNIIPESANARTIPGQGILAESAQGTLLAGSRNFLAQQGIEVPQMVDHPFSEIHVAAHGDYLGNILLEDPLRPESKSLIEQLKRLGIKAQLLTGDHPLAARAVGTALDIPYTAQVPPEAKCAAIERMQAAGEIVLMVGDGINDGPALTKADVGCSLAGSSDLALETADLLLTKADLTTLTKAIVLAQKTLRIIRQNIFWAFLYNLCALPLAMMGKLHPIYAAGAMATSSIFVVLNSLRLKHSGEEIC